MHWVFSKNNYLIKLHDFAHVGVFFGAPKGFLLLQKVFLPATKIIFWATKLDFICFKNRQSECDPMDLLMYVA